MLKILFFCLLVILYVLGCDRNTVESEDGIWISDIPFYLPEWNITLSHDNRIFETDNYLVFSDGSSDEVKKRFARYAEESLAELMRFFNIPNSTSLGIVDRDSKITIYSNRYKEFTQRAFAYGFVLYGEDSEVFQTYSEWQRNNFKHTIKHELMHVLVLLLGLTSDHLPIEQRNEFWFNEGIAEYVSGGAFEPIITIEQLNEWKSTPGDHINPVSLHRFSDSPVPFDRIAEYYPMFGLAVWYLLDEKGLGKTPQDVMQMIETLSGGEHLFVEAFEMHFGITVNEYELSFFDRISEFFSNE